MSNENRTVAKQLFDLITRKIALLRIEMELLEIEGNGLRLVAEELIGKLSATAEFTDAAEMSDTNAIVHQKWAEQAQRYNMEANTIARILLDKSKQMLDLVQFLKKQLRELGYEIPEEVSDFHDWDDILLDREDADAS